MKRKDKLVVVMLVAIIANLAIVLGIINNAGVTTSDTGCFRAENGVKLCR